MAKKTRAQARLEAMAAINEAIEALEPHLTEDEAETIMPVLGDAFALVEDIEPVDFARRRANLYEALKDIRDNPLSGEKK